ncbi:unnamed protein product [Camellia sinensis]
MPCSETISSVDPTHHYASLISYSIKTQNLKLGRLLHSHLIKTALSLNNFLTNQLIHMYSKCNSIACAQKAFDDLPIKNTHSWNTMISVYSQRGRFVIAHNLFDKISEPNLGINDCACLGALELLRRVHGAAVAIGMKFNTAIYNALIDAYGKCHDSPNAFLIFNQMGERDVLSWTSMVIAYARASRLEDAYQGLHKMGAVMKLWIFFVDMQEEGIFLPNAFTYVSVLSACADLALLDRGKQLHGHIIRSINGEEFNVFLFNALIDMYCKCGDMKSARTLFEGMPKRDIVSWNSLINGYAQDGNGDESLAAFKRMTEASIKPNHATFLGVFSACSHAGLLHEGLQILDSMVKDYDVIPRSDHYTILIDLFGRKNRLKEAIELIDRAPNYNELNRVGMWGALLGTCRIHGNLELAYRASAALFELEPQNAARHVMLSNVYAAASKWEDARQVRAQMDSTNG